MSTKLYPGVILRETDGFSIVFPDLPGLSTQGKTLAEVIAMAQEALNLYLEDMDELPEASDAATALLKIAGEYKDAVTESVQWVPGSLPGRALKYTISMDEELMKRVDAAAGENKRSGWIADACRERLRAQQEMPVFDLINDRLVPMLDEIREKFSRMFDGGSAARLSAASAAIDKALNDHLAKGEMNEGVFDANKMREPWRAFKADGCKALIMGEPSESTFGRYLICDMHDFAPESHPTDDVSLTALNAAMLGATVGAPTKGRSGKKR